MTEQPPQPAPDQGQPPNPPGQVPPGPPPPQAPGYPQQPPPGYGYPPPPPPGSQQGYPPPGQPGYFPGPIDPNAPVRPLQPNDTLWAVLSHLSYFILAIIFPLIVMLTVGNESPYVRRHSVEALNFHISLLIYSIASALLILLLIGIVLLPAVLIFGVVMTIIAAVKSGQGEDYRYPLCIRMVS